jgi:outer membrane autotransporter protein
LDRGGVPPPPPTSDIALRGLPETADVSLTQVSLGAGVSPGIWQLRIVAGRSWGEVDTQRGGDAIGGVARASYDASIWFASAEAGPEFAMGAVSVRPIAGMDWSRVTLRSFRESGGIALTGGDDTEERMAATLGAQVEARWSLPRGPGLRLWADARGGQVFEGKERTRAVAFAANSGEGLRVTSASESGTYAEGRVGGSLFTGNGFGLHLRAEGRTGSGGNSWRATAGVSAAF